MDDRSAGEENDEDERAFNNPEVSVQAQNTTGDNLENELKDLHFELAKIKEKLSNRKGLSLRVVRRLKTHKKNLEQWIEDASKNNNMPPETWRDQIKHKDLHSEEKKSTERKDQWTFPDYPDIVDIKHARVLVLAITRFQSATEDRAYDDTYGAVRRSFIDRYGYEDVLERIMINMIVLEKMKFKTEITIQDIQHVLEYLDPSFQINDFDVEHLKHFNKKYNSLYNKLTETGFWNKVLKHFKNTKSEDSTLCFQNTHWTSDEMRLMLDILIEDPNNKTKTNALILFVSSHGNTNEKGETVIFDGRKKKLEVNKIINMFSKPFIQNNEELCCFLFFHGCRGDKKQEDHCVEVEIRGNRTKCPETNDEEDVSKTKNCQGNANTTGIDRRMTDTGAITANRSRTPESTTSEGISESSPDNISIGIANIVLAKNYGAQPQDGKENDKEDFISIQHSSRSIEPNLPFASNSPTSLDSPVAGRYDVEAGPFSCENFGSSGYCPNNCLVAYSTTPGFTAASDPYIGCLYIETLCLEMLEYEKLPLLPFLTMLHGKLVSGHCEMPMFDHSLYKMPIFYRNNIKKDACKLEETQAKK